MSLILFVLAALALAVSGAETYDGPWRKSLDGSASCWTSSVSQCDRVMTTSHGGDWNVFYPYDSMPAFQRAFEKGADAVKGDFRVAMDGIGMVMHSSPVEIYESVNCFGKYVEKMTSEECQQCRMEITNYTFISAPTLLDWAKDKVNVMFCVKESSDIPRAISTLIENNATHRAYLEVHLNDLLNLEASNIQGWDSVYYTAELKSSQEVATLLAASDNLKKHAFLFEFNGWEDESSWSDPNVLQQDITAVQAAGFRTFAATRANPYTATLENHLHIFELGFDVVYTYNLTNAVQSRQIVNTKRLNFPA